MVLADTLLRAYIDDCSKSQSTLEEDLACVVHMDVTIYYLSTVTHVF